MSTIFFKASSLVEISLIIPILTMITFSFVENFRLQNFKNKLEVAGDQLVELYQKEILSTTNLATNIRDVMVKVGLEQTKSAGIFWIWSNSNVSSQTVLFANNAQQTNTLTSSTSLANFKSLTNYLPGKYACFGGLELNYYYTPLINTIFTARTLKVAKTFVLKKATICQVNQSQSSY